MNLKIASVTCGTKVGELVSELSNILEDNINEQFQRHDTSIGIIIRTVPKNYERRSFVRYTKADNYLTIDFCVTIEDYLTKYRIEQQFDLGVTFLSWLEKGLKNKEFTKHNPDLDRDLLLNAVMGAGRKNGWFADEIDWSKCDE